MRQRLFFVLALICGLIAAGSVYFYLNRFEHAEMPIEKKSIVIAKTEINARSIIKPEDLMIKEVPAMGYPSEGVTDIQGIAGNIALINLKPGDLVLRTLLEDSGLESERLKIETNALAVPEGKRAVAIPISLVSGVGYTVKPGDYVDVLLTIDVEENEKPKTITTLAAQDVLVLNTGDQVGEQNQNLNTKSYILALTVPQAMAVTLGSEKGSLRLMLRNPANKEIRKDAPIDHNVYLSPDYFSRIK